MVFEPHAEGDQYRATSAAAPSAANRSVRPRGQGRDAARPERDGPRPEASFALASACTLDASILAYTLDLTGGSRLYAAHPRSRDRQGRRPVGAASLVGGRANGQPHPLLRDDGRDEARQQALAPSSSALGPDALVLEEKDGCSTSASRRPVITLPGADEREQGLERAARPRADASADAAFASCSRAGPTHEYDVDHRAGSFYVRIVTPPQLPLWSTPTSARSRPRLRSCRRTAPSMLDERRRLRRTTWW